MAEDIDGMRNQSCQRHSASVSHAIILNGGGVGYLQDYCLTLGCKARQQAQRWRQVCLRSLHVICMTAACSAILCCLYRCALGITSLAI